ncbi:putative transcription repressor PLATZ family [Helianthus anomalus]
MVIQIDLIAYKNMKMVIFPFDLRILLDEKFFNSCLVHEEEKKNEENSFCMDCCFSLCCHCVIHHKSHKILQIRRYMYNDVLRLKEAQKIFDCSQIQVS